MRTRKTIRGQRGFTLIEILIVGSSSGSSPAGRAESDGPQTFNKRSPAVECCPRASCRSLDMNRYPANFEELIKSTDPKWRGPYLSKQTIPKDPWGKDYVYKTPGDHGPFDIYSLGASGKLDENSARNW
ncbi:MAG: type II secretion system protein GspG [Syntrophales bacterium LBB04]|nr:type II secretion system protein GspG [Syntrophales bacterium LBB04]